MADFASVPIVDVTKENFEEVWPTIIAAVKSATFVAVDNELTGLGERRDLFARDVEQRYKGISEVAKTRSIVSVGLSCFARTENCVDSPSKSVNMFGFNVQTFNLFLMCSENFTVEPKSMQFLVQHGFDFNKQYSSGLPYYRGNDQPKKKSSSQKPNIRQLFQILLKSGLPLVLHNGMVDIVFLYHSFYASLPDTLSTFMADCSEMFDGGMYDTKYLTEFKVRMSASYLEYVFRASQRENFTAQESGWSHVLVAFPDESLPTENVIHLPTSLPSVTNKRSDKSPCKHYAAHGWCHQGDQCPDSHDVDIILDGEHKQSKKRRANAMDTSASSEASSDGSFSSSVKLEARVRGHRAGFDAFMTGFIFAFFCARYGTSSDERSARFVETIGFAEYKNKLFLSGKDIPLQVIKSGFAKTSKQHREKWTLVAE